MNLFSYYAKVLVRSIYIQVRFRLAFFIVAINIWTPAIAILIIGSSNGNLLEDPRNSDWNFHPICNCLSKMVQHVGMSESKLKFGRLTNSQNCYVFWSKKTFFTQNFYLLFGAKLIVLTPKYEISIQNWSSKSIKRIFSKNCKNAILHILTLFLFYRCSNTYRVSLPYGFAAIDWQNEIM